MNGVCLIAIILWGVWDHEPIGEYNITAGIRALEIAHARNDNKLRLYGGSDDSHIYEFAYTNGEWVIQTVGEVPGSIHSLAIGPGRNDLLNRLYASSHVNESFSRLYEFTWAGNTWNKNIFGPDTNDSYSMVLGNGRNDDTLRLYSGSEHNEFLNGECFEYVWRDGTWWSTNIGGSAAVGSYQHDMDIGYGHNDDTVRIYTACRDGNIWEFTFNGSQWVPKVIATVDMAWSVCIAQGRNDGISRAYVSTGTPQNIPGTIQELTWKDGTWVQEQIWEASTSEHMLGVGAGNGRGDDTVRIYTGTFKGSLYELTWADGAWQETECGNIGNWQWIHDIVVAPGRNDDSMRVYVGGGDGRIHEYTWRHKPKIRVYPDSSTTTIPGSNAIFHLWVVNEGTYQDTIDITAKGNLSSWTIDLLNDDNEPLEDSDSDGKVDVGLVGVQDSVRINVKVTAPVTARPPSIDSTIVFGISSIKPDIYDTAILVIEISGILVDPNQRDSLEEGGHRDYHLTVSNCTSFESLVNLTLDGPSTSWIGEILDASGEPLEDSDGDDNPDVGPLAPGENSEIIFSITAPDEIGGGLADTTVVWGTSNLNSSIRDSAALITTVMTLSRVMIFPDSDLVTPAGVPVWYRAIVINYGNRSDAVDFLRKGTRNWQWTLYDSTAVNPLTDSDGDSYVDAGTLAPAGGTTFLWFELTPAENAKHNQVDTTYLLAFSSFNHTVRDSIRLLTRVINPLPGVRVEPDTSVVALAGQDNAYYLRVVNSGDQPDKYRLLITSEQGWKAAITDSEDNTLTATGDMASGEIFEVKLHVTPPEEFASTSGNPPSEGEVERLLLRAVSISDETIQDSALVLIHALPPLSIHNYPNPFRGSTTFIYSIPEAGKATLAVYNRAGEHIVTLFDAQEHSPGIYTVSWDASTYVAPGVYLYSLVFQPEGGKPQKVVKKALLQP